ncbi:hypothetical protein ACROYT_G006823 [Oculina patagonica]
MLWEFFSALWYTIYCNTDSPLAAAGLDQYKNKKLMNSPLPHAATSSLPRQINGSPQSEAGSSGSGASTPTNAGIASTSVSPLQLEEIRSRARLRHKTDGQRSK